MYGLKNYINRASMFANNNLRPGKKKLATLMFYATDLCDSACKHCLIWAKRPVKHMPFAKIKEVMESKCVTKNTTIGLEGGEFLLHPEAMDIMKFLHENHPKFDLLSNCLKPESTIEAVKKHPPERLYISLDGTRDTYKYMRGKDGYDSVLKVIENCHKDLPISTMFTLSPYNNFDDMKHVAEVCKRFGVDMRVGVYNDIAFFDTVEKAHQTDIGTAKTDDVLKFKDVKKLKDDGLLERNQELSVLERTEIHEAKHDAQLIETDFKGKIPQIIKDFRETMIS